MLPAETEQRVKQWAFDVCQDHLRKVLALTRKVPQVAVCFTENNKGEAKQLLNEIKSDRDEVDKARRLVSQELAEIGAVLLSREDFLRFTSLTSEIADFSEGIVFRLVAIMERRWKVPMDMKKNLLRLSEAVFETILRLREAVIVLKYGSAKTMEKAKDVEIAEHNVDTIYNNLQFRLLTSKIDLPALLLLKDVLQLLEDSADKAQDAADATRILSFIM